MKNIKYILFCLIIFSACGYNPLVELDERADNSWYQIEDVYNRQSDLVPLLIKQFKDADKNDVKALLEGRKEVADVSIAKENIEIKTIKKYIQLQKQFTDPLDRIVEGIYEKVKSLPAGNEERETLKTLASQIMGSQNRIAVACDKYNEVVDEYNDYQGGLTQKATADIMGFHHKEKLSPKMFERQFPDFESLDTPEKYRN